MIMKRLSILLMFILFSIISCKISRVQPEICIINPFVDVSNIKEASDMVGFEFNLPKGPEDRVYRVMYNGLIEVIDIIGMNDVVYRKARLSDYGVDISGDYSDYSDEYTIVYNGANVIIKGNDQKVNLATWDDGEYAYSISINLGREGISQDDLQEILSYMIGV